MRRRAGGVGRAAVGRARAAGALLVAIVVDQLAAWAAAERWPELPADGGFARCGARG